MSVPWFKNFCGMKCTDFELLKVPNPKLEFTIHVTAKTVQCATFFSSVIIGPLYHELYGKGSRRNNVIQCGLYGAAAGLVVGPIISAVKINEMSQIELFDRCYRLRFNRPHLNIDRTTFLGAVIGTAFSGGAGLVLGVDLALLANFLIAGTTPITGSIV